MKIEFEDYNFSDIDVEDSGMAKIGHLTDYSDKGMFVRIQSWDDNGVHSEFDELIGKHIKVTIEIVE